MKNILKVFIAPVLLVSGFFVFSGGVFAQVADNADSGCRAGDIFSPTTGLPCNKPNPIVLISSNNFAPAPSNSNQVALKIAQQDSAILSEIVLPKAGKTKVPIFAFKITSDNGDSSLQTFSIKVAKTGGVKFGNVRLYSQNGTLIATSRENSAQGNDVFFVFGDPTATANGRTSLNIKVRKGEVKGPYSVKADLLSTDSASASSEGTISTNIYAVTHRSSTFPLVNHFSDEYNNNLSPVSSPQVHLTFGETAQTPPANRPTVTITSVGNPLRNPHQGESGYIGGFELGVRGSDVRINRIDVAIDPASSASLLKRFGVYVGDYRDQEVAGYSSDFTETDSRGYLIARINIPTVTLKPGLHSGTIKLHGDMSNTENGSFKVGIIGLGYESQTPIESGFPKFDTRRTIAPNSNTAIITSPKEGDTFTNNSSAISFTWTSSRPFIKPSVRLIQMNGRYTFIPLFSVRHKQDLTPNSTGGTENLRVNGIILPGIHYRILICDEQPGVNDPCRYSDYFTITDSSVTPPNNTPSITVHFPNEGETIDLSPDVPQAKLVVLWNSSGLGQRTVNIDLLNSTNYPVRTIAQNVPNTGSFEISAASLNLGSLSLLNGRGSFKVRMSTSDGSVSDTSDRFFTLISYHNPQLLRFTAPTDGSRIAKDQPYTIRWTRNTVPTGARTKIELTRHVASTIDQTSDVFSRVTTDDSFVWNLSAYPIGNYALTISCYQGATSNLCNPANQSSNFDKIEFSIVPAGEVIPPNNTPSVTVTSPNGGSYKAGDPMTVRWTTQNISPTQSVISTTLHRVSDQSIGIKIGAVGMINDGVETWTIPSNIVPGSDYFIRVNLDVQAPQSGQDTTAESPIFSITPANTPQTPFQITFPIRGDTLIKGQHYNIKWSSPSTVTRVKLSWTKYTSLGYPSGGDTIVSLPNNPGFYDWLIPASFSSTDGNANRYKIKVTNLTGGNSAESEYFTILAPATSYITINPSVMVTSPNGGESYLASSLITATWTRSNLRTTKVELFKNNQIVATYTDIPSGAYSLPITLPATPGTDYKIRVSGVNSLDSSDTKVYSDESDGTFTIRTSDVTPPTNRPPVISGITAPTILSVGQAGTFSIEASDPNNDPLSYAFRFGDEANVAGGAPATEAQAFVQRTSITHSYLAPGTYTVTITVRDNGGLSAQASATVQVRAVIDPVIVNPPANVGPLAIIYPVGVNIIRGNTISIRSTAPSTTKRVRLRWLKYDSNGYSNGYGTIISEVNNTGSYDWLVPSSLSVTNGNSNRYKIEIRDLDSLNTIVGGYFTIVAQ